MLKVERHDIIGRELEKQGYVLVPTLGEMMHCSEETIRRDLKEMEKEGKLVRTHGGAYQVEKYDKGYPMELRRSLFQKTKEHFAYAVLSDIEENDVIMIDSSTTCLALAEELMRKSLSVTLITNSLTILKSCSAANSNINLVCVGGAFKKRTESFADPNTVDALKCYHADKAFISCPKITMEFGLSDNHISEANVRKQMLKQSQKRYLLADHTKFDASANVPFCGADILDCIVTDQPLGEDWEKYAKENQIALKYTYE